MFLCVKALVVNKEMVLIGAWSNYCDSCREISLPSLVESSPAPPPSADD